MQKTRIIFSALVIGAFLLSACGAKTPNLSGQEVTIAVENAYPPFNYIDEATGEPAGWDYDVWAEICKRLDCTPTFVEAAWEGLIPAVADGTYDAAADGITITPDRAEIVDFSRGYATVEVRLLVRIDETRITSIEDIVADESLVLATQPGTTDYEVALKYLPAERVKGYDQFPFAVQALIAGDVDAVIIDDIAGQGYLGENATQVKLVGASLSSDLLGFIFPLNSDLTDAVNQVLLAMMADGTLTEISANHGMTCDYSDPEHIFCGAK